jgi:hypothetical protein
LCGGWLSELLHGLGELVLQEFFIRVEKLIVDECRVDGEAWFEPVEGVGVNDLGKEGRQGVLLSLTIVFTIIVVLATS